MGCGWGGGGTGCAKNGGWVYELIGGGTYVGSGTNVCCEGLL
jgi:hypothetical protein